MYGQRRAERIYLAALVTRNDLYLRPSIAAQSFGFSGWSSVLLGLANSTNIERRALNEIRLVSGAFGSRYTLIVTTVRRRRAAVAKSGPKTHTSLKLTRLTLQSRRASRALGRRDISGVVEHVQPQRRWLSHTTSASPRPMATSNNCARISKSPSPRRRSPATSSSSWFRSGGRTASGGGATIGTAGSTGTMLRGWARRK